jgi:hypothetical protein
MLRSEYLTVSSHERHSSFEPGQSMARHSLASLSEDHVTYGALDSEFRTGFSKGYGRGGKIVCILGTQRNHSKQLDDCILRFDLRYWLANLLGEVVGMRMICIAHFRARENRTRAAML